MSTADSVSSSVLLGRHGAVPAQGLDAGVAAHYGDPVPEQRALARGRAVVDQSQRGVVTVSGPDRLSWLTTLSSQVLTSLEPGRSTEALFLSVQGRVEYAPHVVDDGTTTWLITEAGETSGLTDWLTSMRFALRVDVQDVSSQWAVLAAAQDLSARIPALLPDRSGPAVGPAWQDPWPGIAVGGHGYAAEQDHPGSARTWFEHLVPRDVLEPVVEALEREGFQLAGSWAAEALRIESWRPRWGADTDEKTIPHELDWMRTAVHLSKGCYRGQETVARVHNLGRPPRRLTRLLLDGSVHALPEHGAPVILRPAEDTPEARAAARPVGTVTAAAQHHEAGAVALALLKRTVPVDAELLVREDAPGEDGVAEGGWIAASQEPLVSPDAGQVVGRPRGVGRLR